MYYYCFCYNNIWIWNNVVRAPTEPARILLIIFSLFEIPLFLKIIMNFCLNNCKNAPLYINWIATICSALKCKKIFNNQHFLNFFPVLRALRRLSILEYGSKNVAFLVNFSALCNNQNCYKKPSKIWILFVFIIISHPDKITSNRFFWKKPVPDIKSDRCQSQI